jgi:hypothetical protein
MDAGLIDKSERLAENRMRSSPVLRLCVAAIADTMWTHAATAGAARARAGGPTCGAYETRAYADL